MKQVEGSPRHRNIKFLIARTGRSYAVVTAMMVLFLTKSVAADYRVRLVVDPQIQPPDEVIYVTGNLPDLGAWRSDALPLTPLPDKTWEAKFSVEDTGQVEFKITRGSWETEMVGPDGVELPNFTLRIKSDTTVRIVVSNWRDLAGVPAQLTPERFRNKAGQIELFENWKFHDGDDPAWADPDFNDHNWREISSLLPSEQADELNWEGIGWFRQKILVDSSLFGVPLGMSLMQAGASEIYLNGRLLYRTGVIGTDTTGEQALFNRNPLSVVFPAQTSSILAVRYSNKARLHLFGPEKLMGFRIIFLRDLNDFIAGSLSRVRVLSIYQLIFTLIPLTLAFLHLMIFIFNRRETANLYYALSMVSFGLIAYTDFGLGFTGSMAGARMLSRVNFFAVNSAVIFGLLTIYRNSLSRLPKTFYFFLVVCTALVLWFFVAQEPIQQIVFYIVLALIAAELFRQGFRPIKARNYIIGSGFIILAVSVMLQVLINLDLIDSIGGNRNVYLYGVLALGITVSINLAKNFADINKKIILQEQERREVEIERRILEADNQRKTVELEEARKLQLSMLPSEIPVHPEYEIAMFMRTASEVGGDYYDFQTTSDDTLTIALGDATGHGIKAGILVALIKSLFNTSANTFYLPDFFKLCTGMIKQMSLGNLYMAMMLVRLRKNKMVVTVAGMPPLFIYRAADQKVEELVLKALPLGGPGGISYPQQTTELQSGDTVLMMSDGYFELFNPEGDILDLDRVKSYFQAVGHKVPADIITDLIRKGDEWRRNTEQADDISFVVLRKK